MSQNRQSSRGGPFVDVPMDSDVVGVAQDFESGDFIPPHRHDVAQLIYASHGVLKVETDDGIWVTPPARGVWVPPRVTHSIAMSGQVALRTLYITSPAAPIQGGECCVVQVSTLLGAAILRVVDFDRTRPMDGPASRLVSVVLDEIRDADVAPLHLPMPREPRARAVADRFLSDPSVRRSTRDWAHDVGAGERTLERLYVIEVGTTFGKWQQQARLLEALRLLAAGSDITTTALNVGFATPSAFIAMFKKALGTTPGRYFDQR